MSLPERTLPPGEGGNEKTGGHNSMSGEGNAPESGTIEDVLVMPPCASDLRWHCLHTRPRREKKVAGFCRDEGLRYYLPLRTSVKHYGNRRREHTLPYFPGYLFCCATPDQRDGLIRAGDLANAIPVYEQERLLDDMREIKKALEISAELETFPYLKRGQRVRIRRGLFRGIQGLVCERRGEFRVVLNIHFIQRALAIEVDAEDVEPV